MRSQISVISVEPLDYWPVMIRVSNCLPSFGPLDCTVVESDLGNKELIVQVLFGMRSYDIRFRATVGGVYVVMD